MSCTAMNEVQHQHGRRAATAKRDPTTTLQNSVIARRHKTIAIQTPRRPQVATSNTKAQSGAAENRSVGYFNDSRPADNTAENRVTAAGCSQEIALISHQLFAEGCRALGSTYEALVATAHLLAQICKLTWTVGSLALILGRQLYDTGKRLWRRWVA